MGDPEIERLIGGAHYLSADEIARHPRFAEGRKLYLDRFLALYGDDPLLARLLIESGRFLVYHTAIVLGAGQEPERRESWLTIGRLKREVAMYGLASARHVDELVARLCDNGFLRSRSSAQDRRIHILAPTEKMLAHDRAWLAVHYAPLAVLYPHNEYGSVMRCDPEFQVRHRRAALAFLPLSSRHLASVPEMMLFFNRAAGQLILAALLQAAMSIPDDLRTAMPYEDIGDRFGVSRTHVRQLLVAAADAGLMRLERGGRRIEILPLLWAAYDRSIAIGMSLHDMVYAVVTGRRAIERGFC
ncbi:MAG TPA: hypothetical protein VFT69_06085 [Pseudolabrys sp.]|nr:hypothetical protein [Pseudolabrys sp.]